MLKRVAIALAITLAALALIDRASLLIAPCSVGDSETGYQKSAEDDYCAVRDGIVIAGIKRLSDTSPEAWTALATIAVAAFTLTLWLASEKMWYLTQKSVGISERTLTELERPWIFIDLSPTLHGNPDDEFEAPYALFDIVNHGRGPAIIQEFHGEVSSAELHPNAPLLRDEFHETIGPGRSMEKCKIHCPLGFTYDVAVDLAYYDRSAPAPKAAQDGWEVFFQIVIRYLDIASAKHVSAYCWRYDSGVSRWVKFEEKPGGNEYNYLT